MNNKNIFSVAKTEAEWLRYYCHIDYRKEEYLNDILSFYDVAQPIGYSKVYTTLIIKTCMGVLEGLEVDNTKKIQSALRSHENNLYTCFEYYVYNKLPGYEELIDIILK